MQYLNGPLHNEKVIYEKPCFFQYLLFWVFYFMVVKKFVIIPDEAKFPKLPTQILFRGPIFDGFISMPTPWTLKGGQAYCLQLASFIMGHGRTCVSRLLWIVKVDNFFSTWSNCDSHFRYSSFYLRINKAVVNWRFSWQILWELLH